MIAWPNVSSFQRFWLLSTRLYCDTQELMRLLAEVLIIAGLISLGWNTPFNKYYGQVYTKVTSTLDGMGGSLQKNQDQSVKRY